MCKRWFRLFFSISLVVVVPSVANAGIADSLKSFFSSFWTRSVPATEESKQPTNPPGASAGSDQDQQESAVEASANPTDTGASEETNASRGAEAATPEPAAQASVPLSETPVPPLALPPASGFNGVSSAIRVVFDPKFYWYEENIYFQFVSETVRAAAMAKLSENRRNEVFPSTLLLGDLAALKDSTQIKPVVAASKQILTAVFVGMKQDPLTVIKAHIENLNKEELMGRSPTEQSLGADLPPYAPLDRHVTFTHLMFDAKFYWYSLNLFRDHVDAESIGRVHGALGVDDHSQIESRGLLSTIERLSAKEHMQYAVGKMSSLLDALISDMKLSVGDLLFAMSLPENANVTVDGVNNTSSGLVGPDGDAQMRRCAATYE